MFATFRQSELLSSLRILARNLAASLLGVGLACATANAGVLNLDFGPTSVGTNPSDTLESPYHAVTGNSTNAVWNTTLGTADIAAGSLVYGDGAVASGVAINIGRTLADDSSSVLGAQPTSSSALGTNVSTGIYASPRVARDAIFHNDTGSHIGISLQISGLAAGTYDIYYVGRNTNNGTGTYTHTMYAGQSAAAGDFAYLAYASDTISYLTNNTATWVQGVNYAKLSLTLAEGNQLNLAFAGNEANAVDKRAFLNSLQVHQTSAAPTPEPSSLILLALGGLAGIVYFRRKRTARRPA